MKLALGDYLFQRTIKKIIKRYLQHQNINMLNLIYYLILKELVKKINQKKLI